MKYETIGGDEKDTDDLIIIVRHLRIGDRFKTKSSKHLFEVWDDKCRFSGSVGSAVRKCKNLDTGAFEYKLCRMSVKLVKN